MNAESKNHFEPPVWHIGVAFVVASLLFAALVTVVKLSTQAPAIDADRDAVLSKALFEIRTNETVMLKSASWVDRQRGIVRLPIQTAMRLAAREWQNPAQARADLISRENKAIAPLPKQPAKSNPFE
jgi:hypothetical protein